MYPTVMHWLHALRVVWREAGVVKVKKPSPPAKKLFDRGDELRL